MIECYWERDLGEMWTVSGNECSQPLAHTVRHVIRMQGFGCDHAVRIVAHLACCMGRQWLKYRDIRPLNQSSVRTGTARPHNQQKTSSRLWIQTC